MRALWTVWSALEEKEEEKAHLNIWVNLPAAAVWVSFFGESMWRSQRVWEPSPEGGDPACRGGLWTGRKVYSGKRWTFWRERFRWVGRREEVFPESVRSVARKAAERMEGIEKGSQGLTAL